MQTKLQWAADAAYDDSSAPEDEPRHPDLASGKLWPIPAADPDAENA